MICPKCFKKIEDNTCKGRLNGDRLEFYHPECFPETSMPSETVMTAEKLAAKALIKVLKVLKKVGGD